MKNNYLFTTYYVPNSEQRKAEYDFCIEKNKVASFDQIFIFVENERDREAAEKFGVEVISLYPEKRPTFEDYFEFILSDKKFEDSINIVANTDIFFLNMQQIHGNLHRLRKGEQCFALSRWDYHHNAPSNLYDRVDSQDTWVFNGYEKLDKVQNIDFPMGVAGCLSGDTIVQYKRGNRKSGKPIKLKDLYKKFNNINTSKPFVKSTETYIQSCNTENGVVFYNKINNVLQSGIKETIKITFEDYTFIELTKDHLVLTDTYEYKPAELLSINDRILSKGTMKPIAKKSKKQGKRKVVYVKYHPYAEVKNIKGHIYKRVRRYRLVYEAYLNNMSYDEFIYILRNNIEIANNLKYLDPNIEVHHKDENTLNDEIENLEIMSKYEHAKSHGIIRGFPKNYLKTKNIIKIEDSDKQMTYDISVEAPYNNFLANDIFVHNCDNRLAHELKEAGFEVLNPSKTIQTFHLHDVPIRSFVEGEVQRVPPPYHLIETIL